MKSICLVERVKWKFAGNMNPHAFDFGDVDNDKVLKHFTLKTFFFSKFKFQILVG